MGTHYHHLDQRLMGEVRERMLPGFVVCGDRYASWLRWSSGGGEGSAQSASEDLVGGASASVDTS